MQKSSLCWKNREKLTRYHEIQKSYRHDAFGNKLKGTGDMPDRLTYTGQMYDG